MKLSLFNLLFYDFLYHFDYLMIIKEYSVYNWTNLFSFYGDQRLEQTLNTNVILFTYRYEKYNKSLKKSITLASIQ